MDRYTQWDEDGNAILAPRDLQSAFNQLAKYEDTGLTPEQAQDYKFFYDGIKNEHNCNDCDKGKDMSCDFLPLPGENVRWRCPLWQGEKTEAEKMWDKAWGRD